MAATLQDSGQPKSGLRKHLFSIISTFVITTLVIFGAIVFVAYSRSTTPGTAASQLGLAPQPTIAYNYGNSASPDTTPAAVAPVDAGPSVCPTVDATAAASDQLVALIGQFQFAKEHADQGCLDGTHTDGQTYLVGGLLEVGTGPIEIIGCPEWGASGETQVFYNAGGVPYEALGYLEQTPNGLRFQSVPEFTQQAQQIDKIPCNNPVTGSGQASILAPS